MRTAIGLFALLGLMLGWAAHAGAVSDPDDFCTGNPCVITRNKDVDDRAIVDFGSRDVILQAGLDVGSGLATLRAGSFLIRHPGKLRGLGGTTENGGRFRIDVQNDIAIESNASLGAVRLNGRSGGELTLLTTAGSVTGFGNIFLNNTVQEGSGGVLLIISSAGVALTGKISAKGGLQGFGGSVEVSAAGDVSFTDLIDLDGGAGDGGFLDVTAAGGVQFSGEISTCDACSL